MKPDLDYKIPLMARQAVQRPIPAMGPTNPIYDDEVRLFRDNR